MNSAWENGKIKAIKAANAFEFYVHSVWPFHRYFASNKISKRCQRCAGVGKGQNDALVMYGYSSFTTIRSIFRGCRN